MTTDTVFYTDELEDFESSNLEALYYDRDTQTLVVAFLSGSLIGYRNVPLHHWNGLVAADSKGSYYNRLIRGSYHGLGLDFGWNNLKPRPERQEEVSVAQPQNFVVHGVTKVSLANVRALTMEGAVEQFKQRFPDATVTEVTVKFV